MPPAKIFWLDASRGKLPGIKRRRFFASSNMQRNISLVASASNYCRHVQTNAKNFAQRKLLQNCFVWCNMKQKIFAWCNSMQKKFCGKPQLANPVCYPSQVAKKGFGLTKSIRSAGVPRVMSLHLFITFFHYVEHFWTTTYVLEAVKIATKSFKYAK